MDVNTSFAAAHYAQAKTAAAPGSGSGLSFASVAGAFTDTLMRHEITARDAMAGNASPHALVEAYQEILRMPV